MIFFETNPIGRIMSRFCFDVEQTELPLVTTINATFARYIYSFTLTFIFTFILIFTFIIILTH